MHKRVCGPGKANPFTWPLLTENESQKIMEHLDDSTGHLIDHSPERSTVARALGHFMSISREKVPVRPRLLQLCHRLAPQLTHALIPQAAIESITKGAPDIPDNVGFRHKQQQINLIVRAHEWARTESPHIRWNAPPADPFMSLPYWDLYSACEWPFDPAHGAEPWWRTRYRHLMLLFESQLDQSRVSNTPFHYCDGFARVVARLHAFVDVHIAPVYPLVASQLYESLAKHENMLRVLGMFIPS